MAQLGVALWAFLGIGFFGTGVPQVDAELRITAQIVYIAPILVLALWRLRQKPDPFDLCLAIGIVASLVVAIASRDRTGSLETVGLSTAFILLFWAMRTVASVSHIRKALIVGVACALTGWLMAFSVVWIIEDLNWMRAGGGIPDLEPTTALIWVSPNVIPILTLLGIAFLVDLPKGRLRVLLVALFGAASVVAVPLSNGRSAWLGLLVTGITAVALGAVPGLSRIRTWVRRHRAPAAGFGLGALLLAAGAGAHAGAILATNTLEARLFIWREALGVASASPWLGGGQSTFPWLRLTYAPDYAYRVPVYHAHNLVLQTLADGGLVLVAALASIVVSFCVFLWRRRHQLSRRSIASIAVLLGFGAASLLDDFSANPAIYAAVVTIAAWLIADLSSSEPREGVWISVARLAGPIVVLAGLAALPAVSSIDLARSSAAEGVRAAQSENWQDAASAYQRAAVLHEEDAGYHLALGLSLFHLGEATMAGKEYETATRIAPGEARAWGARAALSWGVSSDEIDWLDRASRLTVQDPQFSWRLADEQAKSGQLPAAVASYARAATLQPTLLGALSMTDTALSRRTVADALLTELVQLASLERLDAASVRLDAELATGSLGSDAPPAWQAVAEAERGHLSLATTLAGSAVSTDPWRARGYLASAAVAWFRCDQSAFDQAMRLENMTVDHFTPAAWGQLEPSFDPIYRDIGLGDYQPLNTVVQAARQPWPLPLLSRQPTCSWSPDSSASR